MAEGESPVCVEHFGHPLFSGQLGLCCDLSLLSPRREVPQERTFCIAHMGKAHTTWPFQEALGFYT